MQVELTIVAFSLVTRQMIVAHSIFAEKDSLQSNSKDQLQQISLDEKFKILQRRRYGGYTKLMCALEMKQPVDEIKQLIEEGEDVDAVEFEFLRAVTPVLRYAIDRGNDMESIEIIRLLLQNRASPDARTYNRRGDEDPTHGFMTVFHYAIIYSSPEVVQTFIEFGADVNHCCEYSEYTKSPLETAQLLNRRDMEQVLLGAGAIEKRDES